MPPPGAMGPYGAAPYPNSPNAAQYSQPTASQYSQPAASQFSQPAAGQYGQNYRNNAQNMANGGQYQPYYGQGSSNPYEDVVRNMGPYRPQPNYSGYGQQ